MLVAALVLASNAEISVAKIVVRKPETIIAPLVPQPKINQLKFDKPMEIGGKYTFPAGYIKDFAIFDNVLRQRFLVSKDRGQPVAFDAGTADIGPGKGGYRLVIKADSISAIGRDEEGLRRGMRRLGWLAFPKDGRLMLPTGIVVDEPALAARFAATPVETSGVTPNRQLWDRFLLPLGFNRAIVPVDELSPETLGYLASDFRARSVELIPSVKDAAQLATALKVKPTTMDWQLGKPEAADGKIEWIIHNTATSLPTGIPIRSWVIDRPYFERANPDDFNARMQALKQAGYRPIQWIDGNPDQVYRLAQSAIVEKTGLLTSIDANPAVEQLINAVLAGEYGWSGRGELPTRFPDPAETVRRLLYAPPQPLVPQNGISMAFGDAKIVEVGHLAFRVGDPIPKGAHPVNVMASTIACLLSGSAGALNEKVGDVDVVIDGKKRTLPLIFGMHVGPGAVAGTQSGEYTAVEFSLGEKVGKISKISFNPTKDLDLCSIDFY